MLSSPVPVLKNVTRLDILEAVRPPLLHRFLTLFGPSGARHSTSITSNRSMGIAGLYDELGQVDSPVSNHLRQALLAVTDLADDAGHDRLLAVAAAHAVDLAAMISVQQLNPSELAFSAYLDHRAVFDAAHMYAESSHVRRFVDFHARGLRLDPAHARAKRAQLADEIGRWFGARNRTNFCDVRICDAADETSFLVIHGRPPRAHGVIDGIGADAGRETLSYVPDKQDLIIFRKATGVLSVNAQFPVEQDFYRRVLGRILFGKEDCFGSTAVYTAGPLLEYGALALSAQGIMGLASVELREMKIQVIGPRRRFWIIGAEDDLAPDLGASYFRCHLERGRVAYLKLALMIEGRKRPLLVKLTPPNRLMFDRRTHADLVHDFLLTRGFALVDGAALRDRTVTDEQVGA